jgi:hypothetical protein
MDSNGMKSRVVVHGKRTMIVTCECAQRLSQTGSKVGASCPLISYSYEECGQKMAWISEDLCFGCDICVNHWNR